MGDIQPYIDARGNKSWWDHHIRHRDDGPAIIWADGTKEWCLHGTYLTFNEWLDMTTGLTQGEKVMYKLQYG
jgi:hypothetical protein